MRGLFQTLSGDSSNGSSPHQNNTVYVEPWIQVVKANDTAIKIVCIVSLISLAFVYLLDIFRPHFLHITKTISNFSRLKLKFRQLRSTNWVVIGLVQAVMIMSRVALYLLIHSSLLATLGISDEATNKSYPFHWLIVGCLFLMPLSSIINGFVIDYKWSLARVLLFIVVIIHIITCFTIGCFLMYANSYSKWAPVLVLVVGYIIICFCQTYTDVMLHKIVAQWYPTLRERGIVSAFLNVLFTVDMCAGFPFNSLVFDYFGSRLESVFFTCSGCSFVLLVLLLGTRGLIKPEYDLEYYIMRLHEYEAQMEISPNTELSNMNQKAARNLLDLLRNNTETHSDEEDEEEMGKHEDHDPLTPSNLQNNSAVSPLTTVTYLKQEESSTADTSPITSDIPVHVLSQVMEHFDNVEWRKIVFQPEFFMYSLTYCFIGFVHEGIFVWVMQVAGTEHAHNDYLKTASIIILSLSGILSCSISQIANNICTVGNTDWLPAWNMINMSFMCAGLYGYLFSTNTLPCIIFLIALVLGRDCATSIKHLICMSLGGFEKTGRVSSIINSFSYVGSALGSILFYELYMRQTSKMLVWKAVIGIPLFLAICLMVLLTARRIFACFAGKFNFKT